jgi:hypothetical protein
MRPLASGYDTYEVATTVLTIAFPVEFKAQSDYRIWPLWYQGRRERVTLIRQQRGFPGAQHRQRYRIRRLSWQSVVDAHAQTRVFAALSGPFLLWGFRCSLACLLGSGLTPKLPA